MATALDREPAVCDEVRSSTPAARSASARPAAFSRVGLEYASPATKPIRSVTELDQVLGRDPACRALVDAHRRDVERLEAAVDEHEPGATLEQLPVVGVLAPDVGDLGAR